MTFIQASACGWLCVRAMPIGLVSFVFIKTDMSFKWNDETVLQLINYFQDNEILWNIKHADHKNRSKRTVALNSIAISFGIDRTEVERKLKNVTSHYFREKKKVEESATAADGLRYESKWFAYKPLQFLRGKNKSHETLNSEITGSQKKDETSCSRNKRCNHDGDSDISELLKVLKDNISATKPVRDDASLFGDYIASKIRKMDPTTTSTVEHLIQNIIYQAELGNYSHGSSTQVSNSPECSGKVGFTTSSTNFDDNDDNNISDTKDFIKDV
ncbi:uncharacterized protein LOC111362858 [Spodoptera litura]|uniref:Uncharacterized protein LOC111362858 n=1 Tax=Spodoptera litura TaxID=69820 RepID=A0A9J7EQC3_SPOLT|nr:uncharacterized protein LOC111362858 [Spodoptera litura]